MSQKTQSAFDALSDPTRRAILKRLRSGSATAGELGQGFDLTKPTLSHHFRVLKEAGLVRSEAHGTRVVYTLQTSALEELAAELLDLTKDVATLARRKGRRSTS